MITLITIVSVSSVDVVDLSYALSVVPFSFDFSENIYGLELIPSPDTLHLGLCQLAVVQYWTVRKVKGLVIFGWLKTEMVKP